MTVRIDHGQFIACDANAELDMIRTMTRQTAPDW